jgi:hypothetical protein
MGIWKLRLHGLSSCEPDEPDEANGAERRAPRLCAEWTSWHQAGPPHPADKNLHHGSFGEAKWSPIEMPLSYALAPTLVNNLGFSDIPKLLDIIGGVRRGGPIAQFASKFRSRREPLPLPVAEQVIAVYERERSNGGFGSVAQSYVDALPCVPPRVDNDREGTYHRLLQNGGFTSATDGSDSAPPRATRCHKVC